MRFFKTIVSYLGFQSANPSSIHLPNITILNTGSQYSLDTSNYKVTLNAQEIINSAPGLETISSVKAVDVAAVGSHDIDSEILRDLATQIQKELDDSSTQGVVVTVGTDTREETAMFLDLVLDSAKPVVVVGAMRPATAVSADGPGNLIQAVALAADIGARDRGVMIVMSDYILPPHFTTKTHTTGVNAIQSSHSIGWFVGYTRAYFFYPPSRPLAYHHFDHRLLPNNTPGLPKVEVLYGYQGLDVVLFQSAVQMGAEGVILVGSGEGWWPTTVMIKIAQTAANTEVVVLMSRRPQGGFINSMGIHGDIVGGCGFLGPQQCRIQLQLCLGMGFTKAKIDAIFRPGIWPLDVATHG